MASFDDLQPCNYFGDSFSRLLRAIGWLENGTPYATGSVDLRVFSKLVELQKDPWQPGVFMGVHGCDLCVYKSEASGTRNLFIPANGFAYVCPELIVHYMNAHAYAPPAEFCTAVLACPPMRSMQYLKALLHCARPLVRLGEGGVS
jgi:hypothetical protein